jgi:hypothetical protein
MRIFDHCALLVSVSVLAVACSDSGSPTSSSPPPPSTPTASRTVLTDPSFSSNIQEIFQRRGCTSAACHGAANSENLDLRAGASYNNLVNVRATQVGVDRVIPGNADVSYLVIKLEGRQTVGSRMPLGGTPLDQIDLTNIKNWINQGARNN